MTMGLKPIDRLEVFALMDNVSDPFTRSHQNMCWNESQYRSSVLKKQNFSSADFCRACNGVSLFMRFHFDGKKNIPVYSHPELFASRAFAKETLIVLVQKHRPN